jgi:hypothetical protein
MDSLLLSKTNNDQPLDPNMLLTCGHCSDGHLCNRSSKWKKMVV